MHLVPFHKYFPDKAADECRVATVQGRRNLPDDQYGLVEFYCDDPACDCRRVMINVLSRRQNRVLAVISYGFEPTDPLRGPYLDPLNNQSEHANALLELVTFVLADSAYVARLRRHYDLVKGAAKKKRPFQRQTRFITGRPVRRV